MRCWLFKLTHILISWRYKDEPILPIDILFPLQDDPKISHRILGSMLSRYIYDIVSSKRHEYLISVFFRSKSHIVFSLSTIQGYIFTDYDQ